MAAKCELKQKIKGFLLHSKCDQSRATVPGSSPRPAAKQPCYTACMKAKSSKEVTKFQDIPNIGPAMARDFALLGLKVPSDLKRKSPLQLYRQMCKITGKRQDPCVLDTYIAVIDFMNGAPTRPWYWYTKGRKKEYPDI
jgi:hypothetical protein